MNSKGILLSIILLASITIVIAADDAFGLAKKPFYSPRPSNEPYTKEVHVIPIESVPNSFYYSFSVCATKSGLVTPTVTVKSDLESRTITLTQTVQPGRCYNTSTTIKAQDPASITPTLPQPNYGNQLAELEKKIRETDKLISEKSRELREFANNEGHMKPNYGRAGSDLKNVSDTIKELQGELSALKLQLKQQKQQFYWLIDHHKPFG